MKQRWRAALLLFLLLLSIPMGLCSCNEGNKEEVLAQAERLLPLTFLVNDMCLGEGIAYDKEGKKIGSYYEAKADSLALYGISSLADFRTKISEVYSEGVCAQLYSIVLNPIMEGGTLVSPKRYYETEGDAAGEMLFMVSSTYDPRGVGKNSFSDCRVLWCRGDEAEIALSLSVSYKEYPTQTDTNATLRMVKENGVWRFDSITAKYYDTTDIENQK